MSLYSEYVWEREQKHVMEDENGFATFKIFGEECYVEDVFVRKEARGNVRAWKMVDKIVELVKPNGVKFITTTVCVAVGNPTASTKAIIGYGFKVHSVRENTIIFKKEV